MATDDLELLQRHAPRLLLDRLERFAPVAVEPFLAASAVARGGERLGDPPAELSATASADPAGLHVDPAPDVPPALRGPELFARFAPAPPPEEWRCYGEVRQLARGARALRYWFFYVDNPFGVRYSDVGRHVGDWEQVIVELARDGEVAAVTVMQHGSAHRVPRGSDRLTLEDGVRPRVYVAEGSHAAYLTAGAQPRKLKQDNTSDGGRSGVPQVLPLPLETESWARWPGRWGPDTGPVVRAPAWLLRLVRRIARRGLGGDSPPGPLAREKTAAAPAARDEIPPPPRSRRAHAPGRFAPNAWLSRILHGLGRVSWPREVAIDGAASVVVKEGSVGVMVRVGGRLLRRARYVDVVVVDADGAALGYARARVRGASMPLAIPLVTPGRPAELRLAGCNALDQRSDVDSAAVPG